ncbi:ABC-2 transporter permease [Pseudactinotalea suaedae]|uniref:ABC-2 transporter permease n=1 Tax=Pseudactinotalea suaedae TaxID=1524924 RepID=UPI0012E3010C|nr:ABC-2 transporter permease [Pseudactinotalea suaedae]
MIATFAGFDLMSTTTPLTRFLPSVAAIVAAAVLTPLPAFGILAAAVLMVLLAPRTFANDERGRLDTLYATLPISRRAVVVGRYVALIALYLTLAAVGTAAAVAVTLVQDQQVSLVQLGLVNLACLAFFLLVIAVQLPFFFAVGFVRARPMMYIPVIAGAGALWLAGRLGLQERIDLDALTALHPAALVALSALALAAAVTISAVIAARQYARRSL